MPNQVTLPRAGATVEPDAAMAVHGSMRLLAPDELPQGGFNNHIVRGLPADEFQSLRLELRPAVLTQGQVLHQRGSAIEDLYFVEEGLVLLTAEIADSSRVEVGMTGREGLVGSTVLLNPDPVAVHTALVPVSGRALRISVAAIRRLVAECPVLRDRCFRYVQIMMAHTSQSAACNARHPITERLARCLLTTADHLGEETLALSQDFLAQILGVRRAGVNVSARRLQDAGLIRLSRGRVMICDRPALEAAACGCYRSLLESTGRILGSLGAQ